MKAAWRCGLSIVLALAAALGSLAVPVPVEAAAGDSIVLVWNDALLDAVRASRLGPPITSRALAIVHTCIYDAWAAYDDTALGTRLAGTLRRPAAERTVANKEKAISFAAYRAAVDLYPASTAAFAQLMTTRGYNPADTGEDLTTPSGIGNRTCRAVLEFRHHDGSNQLGDVNGGAAYSDYTGYAPVNAPMDLRSPFNPATVVDPNRWQPLRYVDATGAVVTPAFTTPQWTRVTPFGLGTSSRLRSARPPAKFGTAQYIQQARDLLTLSANLTDAQKATSEYWSDGPRSEQPPGHWNLLAGVVSRRAHHSLDRDAELFFALNNALFDAGIVAWDNKAAFDSERPITAIRTLFARQQVQAWGGPGQRTRTIDGATWFPYQPATFPTPPFAEFTSGHSTYSAAAAEILRQFTRGDTFGYSVTIAAGSSKVEPGVTPAAPVTLSWPTFTAAADQAGLSRQLGGIHFADADLDGRRSGRITGTLAFAEAARLIRGISPT